MEELSDACKDLAGWVEDISTYCALWAMRDGDTGTPEGRMAANWATDAIDGALRELQALRARLVTEKRAFDDATAARADALLEAAREAPLQAYKRAEHIAWHEEKFPDADCWPPYPRTDEQAAEYIAQYTGQAS